MKYTFILLILAGCATTIPQENRTRIYEKTKEEAQQAAVVYLEANGYTLDTGALELGVIKGEQPFNTMTTILVGNGRFELSFLVREIEGDRVSVSLQPKTYTSNAFGVERQNTGSGRQIQEIVDGAFAEYTRIIGGGDMGTVASMQAAEVNSAKVLECSTGGDDSALVIVANTPIYAQPSTGSAILMHLNYGVQIVTYATNGDFTQLCNGDGRAWVKTNQIGRAR